MDPPVDVNRAPWAISGVPVCRFVRDTARDAVNVTAGTKMAIRLPQGGTMTMDHAVSAELQEGRPAAAWIRTDAAIDLEPLASGELIRVVTAGYSVHGQRHLSGRIEADGALVYEKRWMSLNGEVLPSA